MNSFSILISDDVSPQLPDTIESFNKYIPGNTHIVWNDSMIRIFLSEYFTDDVINAYDTLNAYAYKADLASYCILLKLGGLYSAITNELAAGLPELDNKELLIFRDIQKNSNSSWAVACQLIYAKPNNPVFAIAINKIINNVKNKYYGNNSLCITGPVVLGQAVAEYGDIDSYMVCDFVDGEEKVFMLQDGTILAKYKKLAGGEVGIPGTNNYNTIWNNKNVYKENGETNVN